MAYENINVLIADDHLPMRMGLKLLLGRDASIHCVGEASTGPEIVPLIEEKQPDVLLLDVSMPDLDVVALVEQSRRDFPEVEILVVTSYDEVGLMSSLIKAGVTGYMIKDEIDESTHSLVQAVRTVAKGQPYLTHKAMQGTFAELRGEYEELGHAEALSEREIEVLVLASKGLTNEEIGDALTISAHTARNHLSKIYTKLDVRGRPEAIRYAVERGLVSNRENGSEKFK